MTRYAVPVIFVVDALDADEAYDNTVGRVGMYVDAEYVGEPRIVPPEHNRNGPDWSTTVYYGTDKVD